jgi:signal transduction histidine kinase
MKIYFIITELLNNVMKHSNASVANLTIKENNNFLQIQVHDNGKGFDTNKFDIIEGFGLNQIKARVDAMKGNFSIHSVLGSGTRINFEVLISEKII